MCGIVGYVGKNNKALPVLIEGLKNLEYRGYDSAGIAFLDKKEIKIIKEKGKIVNLESKINFNIKSNLGIGHTRWATHGEANKTNSHPHSVGKITLVHNGIIENYVELREKLIKKGYSFKSETDTEVACALIDYLYNKNNDIIESLKESKNLLEGSYALGIILENDFNLYALKNKSPLIIALGTNEFYIASDVPAILSNTNKYILLEDEEIAKISPSEVIIYDKGNNIRTNDVLTFEGSLEIARKNGYEYFLEKEMHEQPTVVKNTIQSILNNDINNLINNMPNFSKYKNINIVACGSAYHAGMVGKSLIEEFGNIPVEVDIASEYRYKKLFTDKKTLVILISQSGETADTLAALNIAKDRGCDTLAIVNVIGSSIARAAKNVLYIKAGVEISVATTKAYLAQITMLSLIALNIGYSKQIISSEELEIILKDIKQLPNNIKKALDQDYKTIAKLIYKNEDLYYLGRKIDYATSLEGSLKLKEISYIHSEAYPAGELKHGTISLIEDKTKVIGIITDESIAEKTISNLKEVKSRGATVIVVTTDIISKKIDCADHIIIIKTIHKLLQPILSVIPLQYIAYETAKYRKCDIDKPKNLAKSVTVE